MSLQLVTELEAADREGALQILSALAVQLREPTTRQTLGSSPLPDILPRFLPTLPNEVGRVAANLAADNNDNRQRLIDAGYVQSACRCLESGEGALMASLLNLVVSGFEPALAALRETVNLSALLARTGRGDKWLWDVLEHILDGQTIDGEMLPHLIRGLEDTDDLDTVAEILEGAAEHSDPWLIGSSIEDLVRFIDRTESKVFVNTIVELSSNIPFDHPCWPIIKSWTSRPHLQACALLCLGNAARSDAAAVALLPEILPAVLLALIEPSDQVLHAAIGLLRNLSISEQNRDALCEGLLQRFISLGVWEERRDLLGSVQGGAIGVVKNLCRQGISMRDFKLMIESFAKEFSQSPARDQLLALIERTNDPAIRFEATRVLVNCVRHQQLMHDERTAAALTKMLQESAQYPVLANEAIIALALISTFGTVPALGGHEVFIEIFTAERFGVEVKENAKTLLRQANNGAINKAVKEAGVDL